MHLTGLLLVSIIGVVWIAEAKRSWNNRHIARRLRHRRRLNPLAGARPQIGRSSSLSYRAGKSFAAKWH